MSNSLFNLIYARSLNNVIGVDNKLPWRISGDLARFKSLTDGGVVVMGRKTWDSLPKRPLIGRVNIILASGNSHIEVVNNGATEDRQNVHIACSPGRVMELIRQYKEKTPWLIGGVSIYKEFAGLVDEVYETVVMASDVIGDTYYKFEGRKKVIREDERMSCLINGRTVDVVNRVLKVY